MEEHPLRQINDKKLNLFKIKLKTQVNLAKTLKYRSLLRYLQINEGYKLIQ